MTAMSVNLNQQQNLTQRYSRLAPLVFLVLLGLNFGVGFILISRQQSDAIVINLAGRQRMLSQFLAKESLELLYFPANTTQDRSELAERATLWRRSHFGLQFGDEGLGLPGNNSPAVQSLFAEINPGFDTIFNAAVCLSSPEATATCTSNNVRDYIDAILANEGDFLQGMDAIVTQLQIESAGRVTETRVIQVIVFVVSLAVYAALGYFVFRPATQQIDETLERMGQTRSSLELALRELQNSSRDLEAVVGVGTQVASILEVNRLLNEVSDLTKERLRLYHAHIYLLDESGDILRLTAGAGAVGRQMVAEKRSIAIDNPNSIVASAARSRRGVVINDVRASVTFLPHPLLPDTRAELAVPLIARGELLGVLDVQSNEVNYFTQQTLTVMELMASQVAVAISNARLYEYAERTSRHERALGSIDRGIQSAVDLDEILQSTVRELGKALRVPHTVIQLQVEPSNGEVKENDN